MSEKSTVSERCYCSSCGRWLDEGETHDWEKHPATIHGDIERVRKKWYAQKNE